MGFRTNEFDDAAARMVAVGAERSGNIDAMAERSHLLLFYKERHFSEHKLGVVFDDCQREPAATDGANFATLHGSFAEVGEGDN